jgi:uncharacterized protein YhfF
MATPSASVLNVNNKSSTTEDTLYDFVIVQDCRNDGGAQIRICKTNATTYNQLVAAIRKVCRSRPTFDSTTSYWKNSFQ